MEKGFGKVETTYEMPEIWANLRKGLLEMFGNEYTEGLDVERVTEFIRAQNLPVKDFIIVDEKLVSSIESLLKKAGFNDNVSTALNYCQGICIPEIELCIVKRNMENRRSEYDFQVEKVLVHELFHASGQFLQYTKQTRDDGMKTIGRSRLGFCLVANSPGSFPWGWFLEEGFAEMQSGDYYEKNASKGVKDSAKMAGFSPSLDAEYVDSNKLSYIVMGKYVSQTPGGTGFTDSAIAAVGLEMLFEKEPRLKQVLIEARSDIEKLREIPKLINAIKPGLYVEIQKCKYEKADFVRVQNIIREAIHSP